MVQVSVEDIRRLRAMTGRAFWTAARRCRKPTGTRPRPRPFFGEKGLASVAKKLSRAAAEGVVESYIHSGSRIGVLLELNCETDFVARTDEFRALAHEPRDAGRGHGP